MFFTGEEGDTWHYSHNSYENTRTQIKMGGKLSQPFEEDLGVRQGQIKSSDHYKVTVSPALETMDKSDLGFWIGPICVGVDAVADDLYLLSDSQVGLQELLNLAQHYGRRYRCVYGAAKTKIVVTGSNIDMSYYKDVRPWTMDGTTVEVVENNDHLKIVRS